MKNSNAINIKALRSDVSDLMTTVQKNQTCIEDVQKLASQLARVVTDVNDLKSGGRASK